ncbi:tRNA pseudouridine(38-40) synthase TruA [Methylocella silvestris]|uniref:tRNA pseudouridine synthase A n=1 Tax=Methylocella silvestris TaxID=199596 RepID=A0A2J7TGF4_METSI|nr:tRNA pseudouridine(38-40) synthase TruA [Methylocella silvestris]PNG25836.1 tRNA pseudouridine(38-40) synthase TruA [Methylocella silvestris]
MHRFKLLIEYDGAPFVGWQRQANGLSVQEAIETALGAFTGEAITIQGAGRTDAGVHARGQVAHADFSRNWRPDVLRDAANAWLRPNPVAILKAERVTEDFSARFSAVRRHYLYKIINRRAPLTLESGRCWAIRRNIDAGAMHQAAQTLLGYHDFSTFRDSQCQAQSPLRTLERFDVLRDGEQIDIHVAARSFLHSQVRSMVGSLEHVGSGKWRIENLAEALAAKDRRRCGVVAPPEGLYLMQVDYEDA